MVPVNKSDQFLTVEKLLAVTMNEFERKKMGGFIGKSADFGGYSLVYELTPLKMKQKISLISS